MWNFGLPLARPFKEGEEETVAGMGGHIRAQILHSLWLVLVSSKLRNSDRKNAGARDKRLHQHSKRAVLFAECPHYSFLAGLLLC